MDVNKILIEAPGGATHWCDIGCCYCRVESGRARHMADGEWKFSQMTLEDFNNSECIHKLSDMALKVKPVSKVNMVTKYELIKESAEEIAKAMIDGEILYNESGKSNYKWVGHRFVGSSHSAIDITGDFYRKVERPITWQEAVDDFCNEESRVQAFGELLYIIKGMDDDFVDLCNLVTSLTKGE